MVPHNDFLPKIVKIFHFLMENFLSGNRLRAFPNPEKAALTLIQGKNGF
jgi:hypothetical protein